FWNYEHEDEAITDVLRLAKGMTYKNAAAGLNLGGGKAVVIGDASKDKSEAFFRSLGRYINNLGGRYIAAEDVGTTVEDMDYIYQETDYVCGVSEAYGSSGNPSPFTALGLFVATQRTAKEAFGSDDLAGKTVAVQGVGNVAYSLCAHLHEAGAKLIVTDINEDAVKRAVDDFGAEAVGLDEIYDVESDIYSPCALGATINDDTLGRLKAKVSAGSANNQLKENKHGDLLEEKGIVYAPDDVINSGGVINVADEMLGYNRERAMKKVETIYEKIEKIFEIAKRDKIPTYLAANRMAEERMAMMHKSRKQFLQSNKSII